MDASQIADLQAKATAARLTPGEIEELVALVVKYGPGIYHALVKLFHHDPKPAH